MKSHVSMEQAQCPVCLTTFDTGSILLDKRLRPSMEQRTVTHLEMCKACADLKAQGFVALIELQREPVMGESPLSVPRTGQYAHIRASAWPFNVPVPKGMVTVVERGMIDKLKGMTKDEPGAVPPVL